MTISSDRARDLLYDWHGGQASPEYAAASSGLVAEVDTLMDSILHTAMQEEHTGNPDPKRIAELHSLLDYLNAWRDKPNDELPLVNVNGRLYLALPWAKEYL